ncbi:DUF4258 domain-containing protein [Carboxydichorda subterranea]|uniref:DUF4258 domain-containing protein n=1 Tax=Carboxydichorda subterranea TaxID=3109565 RepID=UPI0038574D42
MKEPTATEELVFTKHATDVMAERRIDEKLVRETLTSPDLIQRQPDGTTHCIRMFADRGGRWLRVVIAASGAQRKVVTVFFDRRLRGRRAHHAGP